MPPISELETFQPMDVSAALDRDDPSIGEVKFLVEQRWYKFQLPRSELQRLADSLHRALAETVDDLPEG